jgi:hypothetical protein
VLANAFVMYLLLHEGVFGHARGTQKGSSVRDACFNGYDGTIFSYCGSMFFILYLI